MKRVLKFKLLTSNNITSVETSAMTLGELKAAPEMADMGINWDRCVLIDKATKVCYNLDNAILPVVDSLLFVMSTKNSSGSGLLYQEAKQRVKQAIAQGGPAVNYTHMTTRELNEYLDKWAPKPTAKPEQLIIEKPTPKPEVEDSCCKAHFVEPPVFIVTKEDVLKQEASIYKELNSKGIVKQK